jgi:His-Xaa-Ser system protein HxsD
MANNDPGRQDVGAEHNQEGQVIVDCRPLPAWVVGQTAAAVSVSRTIYSRRGVLAAGYKLSDRCAVLVDEDGADRWVVYLLARPGADVQPLLSSLIRELGDQALRDRLEEQFGAVRTLIVAQAFSEGNLLDPQRDDADHRLDPRGTEQRR